MLQSTSLFVVFFHLPGRGLVTIGATRFGGWYEINMGGVAHRFTVRAGDSPVRLHNHDGFECPPRADTEVELRLSPDIGRVGHSFCAASGGE